MAEPMAGCVSEPEDFKTFIRTMTAAVRELRSAGNDMRELFEGMRARRAASCAILDRFPGGGAEAGA